MKRHVGNPVSGEYFWPRPDLLDLMIDSIHNRKESQKLFGLRRIGKSSLMLECAQKLEELGWITVKVNAEDFGGVDSLFTELLAKLKDTSLSARLANLFEQNKSLPKQLADIAVSILKPGNATSSQDLTTIKLYWSGLAAIIGDAIKASDKPVVLFLDELPFMLKNMVDRGAKREELEILLAGLRSWRQDDRLVMVLSGSLGLGWVMREQHLPSVLFNNLNPVIITPLSYEEARAMVNGILTCEPTSWWTDEITEELLENLSRHAFYPIFIQVAFDKIKQAKATTPEDIARIFKEKIEPDFISNFYKQFKDRLKRYDEPTQQGIHALFNALLQASTSSFALNQAADTIAAATPDIDPDDLLDILTEDGFIVIDYVNQSLSPSSPLVTAWWRIQRPRQPRS